MRPQRTETNIRYYTDEQLRKILNVSLLNRNGYKISKIAEMTEADLKNEVIQIANQTHTSDNLLDALTQSMIDFDESRFERTLSTAILKNGFEESFTHTVFPFLVRTGILWAAGTIKPAQEHFITNLIRRKLSVAIDAQQEEPLKNARKFVLFLPEGETHELMLLFIEFILRKNRQRVAYLGNSLPIDDVAFINEVFQPDYFITYLTSAQTELPLKKFVQKMSKSYPDRTLLIGGQQAETIQFRLPANVKVIHSVEDLMQYLSA
ncbi:MAG: B12-binding domain-containing protein [Bacteroidetes bacterium]|nr:B12-binding domain-containing protein [Bacteroidota bacterium]